MKKIQKIFFLFSLFTNLTLLTYATVRVGYPSLGKFSYTNTNGNFDGYAAEYFREIEMYSNEKYEYIEIPFDKAKFALERGDIDLFIGIPFVEETKNFFEFSKIPFCTSQSMIVTRKDADIYYEDFEHFNGLRIGAVSANSIIEGIIENLENRKISINHKTYNTLEEMETAFNNYEIDAMIYFLNKSYTDCKLIYKGEEQDFYLIAKKGDRRFLT